MMMMMMMMMMVMMMMMGAQAREKASAQASEIWGVQASAHLLIPTHLVPHTGIECQTEALHLPNGLGSNMFRKTMFG